ncbi:hypothetical protein L6164_030321 [Bauhinia variegata]|uniref:Uncharacterized protein n=1 Tax=Bauhinia variegata TaxID=167791 RepID=A0ACB9LBS5_BAUVA|nr:hypothetical protein L6164_030321 [Bauhinia variegata]
MMGSEPDSQQNHMPLTLSLGISRPSKPPELLEKETPRPKTTVSVPFQWEEAPGKPRPCHTESQPETKSAAVRTLELPPRLLFLEAKVSSLPSPTTVLDGPYVGRAMSFTTSYRSPRGLGNDNFGSRRWSSFRKNSVDVEGTIDFSSSTVDSRMSDGGTKVKITRVRRRGSFFNLSSTRTHLWASIYEGLKQAAPWRRKQEKHKIGSKI